MNFDTLGLYRREESGTFVLAHPEHVVNRALAYLDAKVRRERSFATPDDIKAFLALRLGALEHEVFSVIFLDALNQFLDYREIFRGTATQCAVYGREIAKAALELNASSLVLCHAHPSGDPMPSSADEIVTAELRHAFEVLSIRVLDHMVVGGGQVYSFAENGML